MSNGQDTFDPDAFMQSRAAAPASMATTPGGFDPDSFMAKRKPPMPTGSYQSKPGGPIQTASQDRGTERAMQQTMGGPPMFVDVPKGEKSRFEEAGRKGYQTGGIIGAGLVAGAGTGASLFAPELTAGTVGTGVLDAAGNEITREVTRLGPSAAREMLSHPLVQTVLKHAAKGAGWGTTYMILKKLGVF